ncbi:MAG: hypothetical protein R3F65_22875 [bacterium]
MERDEYGDLDADLAALDRPDILATAAERPLAAERPADPDRAVEPLRAIPSPLDSSVDGPLADLDADPESSDAAGPFDVMADTGSIPGRPETARDPRDPARDPRDPFRDPFRDPREADRDTTRPADRARRLPESAPPRHPADLGGPIPYGARRVGTGTSSDVVGLLRPDIEHTTGSMPMLRLDRPTIDESLDDGSLDLDASTGGWRRETLVPDRPPPGAPPALLAPEPATIAAARERLPDRPLDGPAWRALRAAAREPLLTAWYDSVLAWVEARPAPPAAPLAAPGRLPFDLALAARPEPVPPALLRLLAGLAPHLIAPVLGRARSRTPSKTATPSRPTPPRPPRRPLLTALGVADVELIRTPERPYTVALDATGRTVRLGLGSALVDSATPAGQSFLLARTLAPVAFGTLPARVLRQREARAFFGALFDLLGADYPLRGRDRDEAAAFREALAPIIDAAPRREAWRALAAEAAAPTHRLGAAALRAALDVFDARVALGLADDFPGALEMLRLLDFDDRPRDALSPPELEGFVADSDLARALLVFAADPACHALRRWRAGARPTP